MAIRALENTRATQEYQLKDKVDIVITARVNSMGDGDCGMVDAKIVATNSAALGLDRLPNNPKRQAESNERWGTSGNRFCPIAGAERLNSYNPR